MKCWCGAETIKCLPDYDICSECETYISNVDLIDPMNFYGFDKYWHEYQLKLSLPIIEDRASSDLNDRIPYWYPLVEGKKSILEIGCAHGGFLKYCHDRGFDRCVGIEIDPITCRYAKTRFNLEEIYQGVFPDICIKGTFDIVAGFDVFEHFTDPLVALKKMVTLLSEFGRIIIQTPRYQGEHAFGNFKPTEHLFIFTEKAIRSIFEAAKLKVIRLEPSIFAQDMIVIGEK